MTNAFRGRISAAILIILEGEVVTYLHIIEDYSLNDLLHTTQFSSKCQLAPFYRTGEISLNSAVICERRPRNIWTEAVVA